MTHSFTRTAAALVLTVVTSATMVLSAVGPATGTTAKAVVTSARFMA